jgi:hypothetical protein
MPTKRLLTRINGRATSNTSFFLPANLRRLEVLTRVDARTLLWDHTVFPYVVSFMPAEDVRRLESKALSGAQAGSLSSLVKSVTQSSGNLRFCPSCASADSERFGESYWHRSHCLAAVRWCEIHRERLLRSTVQACATSRSYGAGLPQHQTGIEEDGEPDDAVLRTLAHISYVAASRREGHRSDWGQHYRRLALSKGFRTPTNDVASAKLAVDFSEFYGRKLLQALKCDPQGSEHMWPALMVRQFAGVPFSPLKHVLLQAFLGMCSVGQKTPPYKPPGKTPRDAVALDSEVAEAVRGAIRLVSEQQIRTTVTAILQGAGFWSAFRHDRQHFPLTVSELSAFRKSDASERKTGGRDAHRKRMSRRLPSPPPSAGTPVDRQE